MADFKNKPFLSTTEAAEILGISRVGVFKRIKRGQLPAKKIGRNYIIQLKDLLGQAGGTLLDTQRQEIKQAIEQAMREYRDVFEMLGKE